MSINLGSDVDTLDLVNAPNEFTWSIVGAQNGQLTNSLFGSVIDPVVAGSCRVGLA